MQSPVLEVLACTLCGSPLNIDIAHINRALEARAARAVQDLHPHWAADDRLCPDCLLRAVYTLHGQRSGTSLQGELRLSYPAYSRDEAQLIPTPLRVHANPRYTGRGVTIAFLDSGFYPHPDLTEPTNRILAHIDATLPEPAERPNFRRAEATSWHGLMVSSVAAGNGFLSGGLYRGVASGARLVLVKTGNRRNHRIPERDILRALQWVVENHERYGIRVVNISLGGDFASTGEATPLDALVEDAVAQGLVVVAAAGNGGMNRILPPASAASAIVVGGLDDQNSLDDRYRRMWRSSYGRGVGGVPKPDLVAPSIWVVAPMLPHTWVHNEARQLWQLDQGSDQDLSRFLKSDLARVRFKRETLRLPLEDVRAIIRQRIVEQKYVNADYQHVDGTSMAAPIVSAVVAQMLEANPRLSPAHIKDSLANTAQPLKYVPAGEQGYGAVEGARAVALALRAAGGALEGLPVSPRLTPEAITFICHAPDARQVALVASFNGWQPEAGRMWETRPGVWQIMLPPPPHGVHAYKFLLDRDRWQHDLQNPAQVEDGSGGFHSLLTIE
jgi:serine protease AprX